MPKRTDISKILIIGSGPIVIGQACEFDYSGTQACKALREEGYEVVLVNSNPATIMTDPELAQRTYIEPLTKEFVEAIIKRERPDALLPTVGGQTALNLAVELSEKGVLERYRVELIGASLETIDSSCCGMAGSFGYEAEHYDVSMRMAELALLPRIRAADSEVLIAADGLSCRHQIADGAARAGLHVARILEQSLAA